MEQNEFAAPFTLLEVGVGRLVDFVTCGVISLERSLFPEGVREGGWRFKGLLLRPFLVGLLESLIEGVEMHRDAIEMS